MPPPLEAVTTDESGANADSATDTDTELAVVDVTRSGSPQVPSAVARTSPNVETNVDEDARLDTVSQVTGPPTDALDPDPPSSHGTTAGTAVLESEEVDRAVNLNGVNDGNEVGMDDAAGMNGNDEVEEATQALHKGALIVVTTDVSGADLDSATDNGSASVAPAVACTSPTEEAKVENDARLNSCNLDTAAAAVAPDPDLPSSHETTDGTEVPETEYEVINVGREEAVVTDGNMEGTASEEEEKEVAPDGSQDSKIELPEVTLADSSVWDQDAAVTAAVDEAGAQVGAGVLSAFTPDFRPEPPCTCCNTLTSPGDRCRARRVLTRRNSRVVPCRLKLGDTPGPGRQHAGTPGTPVTDPAPTQGTSLPPPPLISAVDKTSVLAPSTSTLIVSTSPGKIAQGEVPL
jgi:hypothetical protein